MIKKYWNEYNLLLLLTLIVFAIVGLAVGSIWKTFVVESTKATDVQIGATIENND